MNADDSPPGDKNGVVNHIRVVFSGPRWPGAIQECARDLRAAGWIGPIDPGCCPPGGDFDAPHECPEWLPPPVGLSGDSGGDPEQLRWEWM